MGWWDSFFMRLDWTWRSRVMFNRCLQILPLSCPATILLLSCHPRLRKRSDVRIYPPASCLLLVNVDPTGSSLSLTPGLHFQAFCLLWVVRSHTLRSGISSKPAGCGKSHRIEGSGWPASSLRTTRSAWSSLAGVVSEAEQMSGSPGGRWDWDTIKMYKK